MRPSRLSLKAAVGALAFLAATAAAGAAPARAAAQLTVFGDSYSIPVHDGFRDWPVQLRDQGVVGQVRDFAHSGATASSRWHINFAQQIAAWQRAGRPLGLTVVYLGYNDIGGDTASSRAGYLAGIQALVDAGAASGGNRLYLVQPHDVGSTPPPPPPPLPGAAPPPGRRRGAPGGHPALSLPPPRAAGSPPLPDPPRQRSSLRQDPVAWAGFVASPARRFHATVVDVFAA